MKSENNFVAEVAAMLRLLSAEPEVQIEYLEGIGGGSVDELALELDDLARLAPSMHDAGIVSLEQLRSIEAITSQMDSMSGDTGMWSIESLRSDEVWRQVRKLAAASLADFI